MPETACSLTRTEYLLNSIAQGRMPLADGIAWFEALAPVEQHQVLHTLGTMTRQAHPLADEVPTAITLAQLKATYTPCVMLLKRTPRERAWTMLDTLPQDEWRKSFRLLIALFSIADQRRRDTVCLGNCTHAWHHLDQWVERGAGQLRGLSS